MPSPDDPQSPRFTAAANVCIERDGRKIFRGASASSPHSEADARQIARALALARAEAASRGDAPPPPLSGCYPYPERVLVEPVVERIVTRDTRGEREIARITTNNYHASVLNAYDVMFVDVDTRPDTSNAAAEVHVPEDEAVAALADLVNARPELSFRVYATRAGLRYLCTSRRFDPKSPESETILRLLRADKRYALLCRVQKCYRARLSPKPWRCLVPTPAPKGFFARLLGVPRKRFDPDGFATCRYVKTIGDTSSPEPEIERIITLHDQMSEAHSAKPLA